MAMICLSTLIVDVNVFPQNSQLKALFPNEQLIYVFLQYGSSDYFVGVLGVDI